MNSIRSIVALAVFAAAGVAQAQEASQFPTRDAIAAGKSRAEVVAETHRAMAAGQHVWGNQGPSAVAMFAPMRDRAAVAAEGAAIARLSPSAKLAYRLQFGV